MHVCTNRHTINSVRLHDVSITRQLYALIYHRSFWIIVKCLAFWWLICAMSYFRVFGAKRRKGATRKHYKWWLFRVFAWRPFAPPHESTTLFMRRIFASSLSYLCLAGRKVATWKPAKITIWRVFAWRPFAPPGKDTTNRGKNILVIYAYTENALVPFLYNLYFSKKYVFTKLSKSLLLCLVYPTRKLVFEWGFRPEDGKKQVTMKNSL